MVRIGTRLEMLQAPVQCLDVQFPTRISFLVDISWIVIPMWELDFEAAAARTQATMRDTVMFTECDSYALQEKSTELWLRSVCYRSALGPQAVTMQHRNNHHVAKSRYRQHTIEGKRPSF